MNAVDDAALILGLNWIDIVVIGAAAAIGLWGWRLGILRAGVALIAVVVGVVLAGMYHQSVFTDLAIDDAPSGLMRTVSFSVILTLVLVGGYALGTLLKGLASMLLLGMADRATGTVFGLIVGLLLAQAVFAILVLAGLGDAHDTLGDSTIGWWMMDNTPVVRALLPSEFDLAIQEFVSEVGGLRAAVDNLSAPLNGS